ncbi:TIGR04141 family sporadically distributed protein [Shinella curvata]|uniref:TIGR04141 family sporadically distributed protein n=1 Tax=Shinella curvata TaxID=1817964 RepID=A0ABT8XJD8_9HYPH|nr:DUF6119 family protein [Shinella curvata]MCJ8052775.1 TIGR04141 family sporadically distributed protein [Shinella curvata]MDO6123855.1 TIGR04141 family sporadically distributed protein [Shinella curvata]
MARKSYTLHLAKPDVEDFAQLLSEVAAGKIGTPFLHAVIREDFAEGACLYVFDSREMPPKWLRELRGEFQIPGNIQTNSACAILAFRVSERIFAATFAHGWMYLAEENFEGDFGLRAAINALDDGKLKRLERANLGDAMRGVSLSPFQRDLRSFGLDDALDLVRKVSGKTRDDALADSLAGARSLKVTGEYDLNDLPQIAAEALELFTATRYQETAFQILDVVTPIADSRLITTLDNLAAESIRQGQADFELGLPANHDDDGVAYCFSGPRLRGRFPDLLMRHYISALGARIADVDAQTLRDHRIIAEFEDDARPDQKWSIRKALVGSMVHDGGRYAANEGEWYRIDEIFKTAIEDTYSNLVVEWDNPPVPLRKEYDEDGNGRYQTEASYNAERAAALGYVLLDTRSVNIPGVQRSDFEPCDILDIIDKRFIHVKKSSRRSSVLSHFFKQGSNAAQNFKRYPAAWDQLIALTAEISGADASDRLRIALADVERPWTVEFWIADTPRANGAFNIPFFSKISLRDETSRLTAMGYGVRIRFIGLEAVAI